MVKGKVIDAKQQPLPGVAITIEFLGGSGRKLTTKTDKKGEFVQLLTESGAVPDHRDRSEDRQRQQRHDAWSLGKASRDDHRAGADARPPTTPPRPPS